MTVPRGLDTLRFTVRFCGASTEAEVHAAAKPVSRAETAPALEALTHGGPPRWGGVLSTRARFGRDDGPFAVDVLSEPTSNPWLCQMRLTGVDFLPGGKKAVVCTWDGDVWEVDGIEERSGILSWRRIAAGLFQPLGIKVIDGTVYVTCRDQIVILRDGNRDGETDFYENFNSDHQVTEHFHEFAMGLQTDSAGNFYYTKAARHGLPAVVPQHGTLLRVSREGVRTDIVATGFRAPNGVCVNPDGTFFMTDQEGFWLPKNRVNWVKPGSFHGNMWGYHGVSDSSDAAMEPPVCWITNSFDRSPGEIVRVEGGGWGALEGSLLNLSYGYGKIFIVLCERLGDKMQGGMATLPIPQFPTGIMRGRFHPGDGQFYTCGMYAWAGNQTQPGGFYRVRYTGKPIVVPIGLAARRDGLAITFTGALDRSTATDPSSYSVRVWGLKRSANYGSEHVNERPLAVRSAKLSGDGRTVLVSIPNLAPTWCMAITYVIKSAQGLEVKGEIHNTIHGLGAPAGGAFDEGAGAQLALMNLMLEDLLEVRDADERLAARAVLAHVGCGLSVPERPISEQCDFASEQRGLLGGRRGYNLARAESPRNRVEDCPGHRGVRACDHGEFGHRSEQEVECNQALSACGRLALEYGLNGFERRLRCTGEIDPAGQGAQSQERGRGEAAARRSRVVVDVFLAGDQRFVAAAGEIETPLLRIAEFVDHDRRQLQGGLDPARFAGRLVKAGKAVDQARVVVEIGVELRLFVLERVQKTAVGLSHPVEDEAGGAGGSFDVAFVGENAAAFGQGGDHQAVPGNENLGVHGRRHALFPCGEKESAAGCEFGFEFALVTGEQFGRLFDRLGQVEDVVIFPVPLLGDVIDVTERLCAFSTEHGGDFLERPDVELTFHPFAIGIFGRIEPSVSTGHAVEDVIHCFAGDPAEGRVTGGLQGFEIGRAQQRIIVEHFFEMWDEPFLVGRIAREAAAEVVVDTSPRHFLERVPHHVQGLVVAGSQVMTQQHPKIHGVGKLRARPKPP